MCSRSRPTNKFLKETIVAVRKDVEAGLSLSDSMSRHPKVFSPLFVAMTQAGETGGVLEDALMRVADQLQKDAALRRQIKSAMVYPVMVIIFAVAVMMARVAFLVPVFVGVFKQFGGELPKLTQVSVFMSEVVTGYWWAALRRYGPTFMFGLHPAGRSPPVGAQAVGPLPPARADEDRHDRQQVAVARWSRTLASLTVPAVPLLQALEITGRTGGNYAVEEAIDGVIGSVKRGGTIAAPWPRPCVPGDGDPHGRRRQETGALDEMLDRMAEFYEEQVEALGQGADLDPRADHDHRDRRHRRFHRHLDVPAAVPSLQPHRIAGNAPAPGDGGGARS